VDHEEVEDRRDGQEEQQSEADDRADSRSRGVRGWEGRRSFGVHVPKFAMLGPGTGIF
jgi:hypothetical protein